MNRLCCKRCVMDTSDGFIEFDKNGVCNYCNDYSRKEILLVPGKHNTSELKEIVSEIKKKGNGNKYDCIVGISGGLDSSYLLYYTKQAGLNPLAVHYDCGWNTEKAVRNIELLIQKLNIDLYTYVVNWEEFRDVQLSYLKSGVVDLEIPTDHSFVAALYKTAFKFGMKYILTGHNFVSEGIMPQNWVSNKGDAANLKHIHRIYGNVKKLKSFPILTLGEKFFYYNIKGIKNIHLLNYINYNKLQALKALSDELRWQSHPNKHGESIWTRFYQCYILPMRFGIDKRKVHLSNLICSGQITRQEAIEELKKPIYDERLFKDDKEFILKKFEITDAQLTSILQLPVKQHKDFKSDEKIKKIYNNLRSGTAKTKKYLNISSRW